MTVQEIFDLRRAGQVEEAYRTILPMYKVHHGKYTTLAMFWCAVDMAKLRLSQVCGNTPVSQAAYDEAERIHRSLQNLYPNMNDEEGSGKRALMNLRRELTHAKKKLNPNSNSTPHVRPYHRQ